MSCKKESEEIREFIQDMLQTWKTHGLLLCGSAFEMPLQYVLTNISDIDVMYFPLDICALPVNNTLTSNEFQGKILKIESDTSYPGFVRLFDASQLSVKHSDSGPASIAKVVLDIRVKIILEVLSTNKEKHILSKVDRVYAIYCPCWPAEADEWISRERKLGWPSKDTVATIVARGCHCVAKSPHSNPSDYTLWRISFSLAETILVHTWTDVQKYVYHLLKLIKTEVLIDVRDDGKKVLCTYFLKTLMFWACEEKGPEFWEDENLENSVACLVCLLIEWLIERHCPNYFIPNNNMLCGLTDGFNLNDVIELLSKYCLVSSISQMMSKHERAYPEHKFKVKIPNKLLLIIHSNLAREFHINPISPDLKECVMNSLTRKDSPFWSEWINLHKAITTHLRLIAFLNSNGSLVDAVSDIRLALGYFMQSLVPDEGKRSEVIVCLGESYYKWAADSCREIPSILKSSKDHKTDKELQQYCKIGHDSEPSDKGRCRMCCYRRKEDENPRVIGRLNSATISQLLSMLLQTLLEEVAKRVDKPSLLVSSAYLANFCYTILNKFNPELAYTVLEDTFKMLSDASGNLVSVERLFPVAITNKLSPLFDKHFQTVLGFLTLCRWATESSNRSSPIVCICPKQLLKYVGIQFGRYKHFRGKSCLQNFRCDHSFHISFDFYELFSEKFMNVVLRLSQFSKQQG